MSSTSHGYSACVALPSLYNMCAYLKNPQFTVASTVYYLASILFPARETMIDHPIFDDTDEEKTVDEHDGVDQLDQSSMGGEKTKV